MIETTEQGAGPEEIAKALAEALYEAGFAKDQIRAGFAAGSVHAQTLSLPMFRSGIDGGFVRLNLEFPECVPFRAGVYGVGSRPAVESCVVLFHDLMKSAGYEEDAVADALRAFVDKESSANPNRRPENNGGGGPCM
ncbi:MAG TPA: hypothetical protein PKB04_10840 [Phenylobacterium sp.]|nr:hypothetical protein [Phenylobacterium sp.]